MTLAMIQTLRVLLLLTSLLGGMPCRRSSSMPQPPEIAARAYLLLDVTANQVLAELCGHAG
jgi:D-alanyl-D-alanine carboxypeptidase (penicillin-binding protein 5/6)